MSWLRRLHARWVAARRTRVLSRHLADLIPPGARVLDVGCGDGQVSQRIQETRPDVQIQGIDVHVRPHTHIPVQPFDGRTLPHADDAFDVVLFVDVLHHTDDPDGLLREASRVARRCIVIKDHDLRSPLARPLLRFMDRVGNPAAGVAQPYNYWPRERWLQAFRQLGLEVELQTWRPRLDLFPPLADWLFGRSLHFVARLDVR